ncbi:Uncharacterised protein [Salmonella enterica subsp. arizonae]|uniref:Uncharacterized protein n=2 Tax=Salmonella enterica TaxID=28901 RepID=A0A3S4G4Z5_SALER|nr:Uncharacterised protein [Salmonella enterica subsp. diarizonae]VEA78297.1 Uncharacterised protein [Salmonella enterica subsp. arizonae]VFS76917.1 Uncharacterised protein [Salmonella enterica subsp. diarizonae]
MLLASGQQETIIFIRMENKSIFFLTVCFPHLELNVTESDKICAVAHIITYWLQKEIDNSHREK